MTNDSDTHPLVIISFWKEIMFWICYLPTLWQNVIKFPVFFLKASLRLEWGKQEKSLLDTSLGYLDLGYESKTLNIGLLVLFFYSVNLFLFTKKVSRGFCGQSSCFCTQSGCFVLNQGAFVLCQSILVLSQSVFVISWSVFVISWHIFVLSWSVFVLNRSVFVPLYAEGRSRGVIVPLLHQDFCEYIHFHLCSL